MIKKLFFLTSIACLGLFAQAQSSYTSAVQRLPFQSSAFESNPICNWNDSYSLTFLKAGDSSRFVLINHADFFTYPVPSPPLLPPTLTERHATVPPFGNNQLIVNDIYIDEDTAFFCGTIHNSYTNTGTAIYGYFDLMELLNGFSLNITYCRLITNTSPSGTTAPTVLYRLVAYRENGSYKVVAFGDDLRDDPYGHFNCVSKIVEVFNATSVAVPGSPYCEVADLAYTQNPYSKQFIHDIFLTENYVVFTRRNENVFPGAVCQACFSFAQKSSVVNDLTSPSTNTNYYLKSANEANDTIIGAVMEGDNFAIAYVHNNGSGTFTRIREIDPTLLSQTHNSIQFKKDQKENPVRMIYYQNSGKLVLLQTIFQHSDFAVIDFPIISATTFLVLNTGHFPFHSFSKVGPHTFISTNGTYIYLQKPFASFPSSSTCPYVSKINTEDIDETMPVQENPMSYGKNDVWGPFGLYGPISGGQLSDNCFSTE